MTGRRVRRTESRGPCCAAGQAEQSRNDVDWQLRYELVAAASGQIIYEANCVTEEIIWGGSIQRVLGYHLSEMNGGLKQWIALIDPRDRDRAWRVLKIAERDGTPYECEYGFRHKDGHYLRMLDRGFLVPNPSGRPERFVGVLQDLTARKEAEEALRRSEERLRAALSAAEMGTWRWDPNTNQDHWDANMARILGLEAVESQHDFSEVLARVHPDDRAALKAETERAVREKSTLVAEYRMIRPDGTVRWLSDQGRPILDEFGRVLYLTGAVLDITERKRLQEERAVLEDQLRQAHKLEALGQLAGGVAHDFGNLVTVILGNVAVLRSRLGSQSTFGESLDMIEQAAQDAMTLARSMLTFSRRLPMEKKPIDLAVHFPKWLHLCRRLVPSNIRMIEHLGASAGLVVHADATQLQQILLNLVINAKDAMPKGGRLDVVLRVARAEDLTQFHELKPERTYAFIEISDSGCGIPADIRDRIFEPFFTTKERGKGTGLGLSVVQSIVRDHDGWIKVSSTEGKGSTFALLFPCLGVDTLASAGQPTASLLQGRGELLLVAEQEPHLRSILVSTLVAAGYGVAEAADGLEFLKRFQELGTRVRLLILSMDLEGPGGLECLRAIRSGGRQTPAILITSGQEPDLKPVLPPGTTVLAKPFRIEDLRGLATDLLASDEASAAS